MSGRDSILESLPAPGGGSPPEPYPAPQVHGELWERFWTEFKALGGEAFSWDDLLARAGARWCTEPGVDLPSHFNRAGPWEADFGLSRAVCAVAETGSLLLVHGAGGRRLASLAPPVHVVLVRHEDIVATLEEALSLLGPANAALVTGPSRTADIEGVLVRGVHGPYSVCVAVET